ncbi:MAG: FAD-dependent monooxygenase [Alphaproteobacteria bacterium]|nr:FAD-dependent monooxygenase [Alphaproteobacteria bacterium]
MNAPYPAESFYTDVAPFHVIIIGGGIGGLALAQGLRKAGVGVAVYERDRTTTSRVQGYRVHINPTGSRALHACLPPHLFAAFDRSCGNSGRAFHFLTEHMDKLLSVDLTEMANVTPQSGPFRHRSVSRITLRQVLLAGLGDVVHFGKTFTRYEERPDGCIVAHFEDGTSAEGDVLVAADGSGSRVRRQFLPHALRTDTGITAIAGKVMLDDETRRALAPKLLDGMAMISARGGKCLFVALQELTGAATEGIGGNDAPSDAGGHFDNTRSYLMWALGARPEHLGLGDDHAALGGEALRERALAAMAGWSTDLKALVHLADAGTINTLVIHTSEPVAPWETGRVTLLGDAIHAMTPYRGIGANVALKDAMRLCNALVAARDGEKPLLDAIESYETEMRRYGFAAVKGSLLAMRQATSRNELGRSVSRLMMRTVDRLPPVKRRMTRRMGSE